MRDPETINRMIGVNSRFANVSESEILNYKMMLYQKTQRRQQIDKKDFKGSRRLQAIKNTVLKFLFPENYR